MGGHSCTEGSCLQARREPSPRTQPRRLPVPWCQPPELWEITPAVQATESMVFCDGSSSWPRAGGPKSELVENWKDLQFSELYLLIALLKVSKGAVWKRGSTLVWRKGLCAGTGEDHRGKTIKCLKPGICWVTYGGDKLQLFISNCTRTLALAEV